jgi:hypothetical protein
VRPQPSPGWGRFLLTTRRLIGEQLKPTGIRKISMGKSTESTSWPVVRILRHGQRQEQQRFLRRNATVSRNDHHMGEPLRDERVGAKVTCLGSRLQNSMTGDQSRHLKVGDRVCWGATMSDLARVVQTSWNEATINWDDGHTASIQHNDMARVERVPRETKVMQAPD